MSLLPQTPSKKLLWLLCVCIVGMSLGPWIPRAMFWYLTVGGGLVGAFLLVVSKRTFFVGLCCVAGILGAGRYIWDVEGGIKKMPSIQVDTGSVVFSGVVDGEVEERLRGYRVTLRSVEQNTVFVREGVLVSLPYSAPRLLHGDRLVLKCALKAPEPIEGYRYDLQLAAHHIGATCSLPHILSFTQGQDSIKRYLLSLKHFLRERVRQSLPEPQASFVFGLVFGGSGRISSEVSDGFARTGLSHVLAASGYNVSLFTFVLLGFLERTRLGYKKSLLCVFGSLFVYTVIAGFSPAVLRASIMAAGMLLALGVKRKPYLPNILALAMLLLLFLSPTLLWFDVGFELSFVATVGLVLFADVVMGWCQFLPEKWGIREALAGSLTAIFVTTPIILWHFGSFSLVAPIANLLILPFIPLLMALVGAWLPIAVAFPVLAAFVQLPIWALSWLMLVLTDVLSAPTFAAVRVPYAHAWALGSGVIVIGAILWKVIHSRRLYASS